MTSSPTRAKRRYIVIPLTMFALAFAAYSAFWVYGARYMGDEVDSFIADQRAMGRTVNYEGRNIEGYPFSLRTQLDQFEWSDANEGWSWSGDRLYIITLPYDVSRLILGPRGDQTYTYNGETVAITGRTNIGLKSDAYSAEGSDLTLTHDDGTVGIGSLRANWKLGEDNRWDFLGSLRQAIYTDQNGDAVEIPYLNAVLAQADSDATGPAVMIEGMELAITDGTKAAPTVLGAKGALGVDRARQLDGTLTLSIRNEKALLDIARRYGGDSASDIDQVEQVLSALTNAGTNEATIPFRLDDGAVFVGPVRLGEIGPVY